MLDGGVDPYNGKAVRASAGSLFHLPVVVLPGRGRCSPHTARIGMISLATAGAGSADLDDLADDGTLAVPTVWLFGGEAHGLPAAVLDRCRPDRPDPDPRARREPQPRGGRRRCACTPAPAPSGVSPGAWTVALSG